MIGNTEKRKEINNTMRWIGCNIFGRSQEGKWKFVKAYDKLKAKVYLDWDIRLNNEGKNLFNTLSDDDLDKVHKSSRKLAQMYGEILQRNGAYD